MKSRYLFNRVSTLLIFLFGCSSFYSLALQAQESDDYYRGIARGLELFGEVYREVLERYVGQIDPALLAERGINGMLSQLDPYSAYLSPNSDYRRSTVRVGIGVEVETRNGLVTIVDIYDGYSAAGSGLRIGDHILAVDNVPIPAASIDSFYHQLKGERGTYVRLSVMREGAAKLLQFDLERERIRIPNVSFAGIVDSGIVYIKLDRFGDNAGNEFRGELLRLTRHERSLEDIRGVIVDLRNNSGGILEEVIEVSNALLPKDDLIVTTDGRDSVEREVWVTERDPVAPGLPLVILVNKGTASASEILAGAVQDNDRGIIVGEPTLGKGLVQSVQHLPFDASLRLTTAWYVTPSGRSIQRLDLLLPDIRSIIPDSLEGVFTTRNGRIVRGGEGIHPDTLTPQFPEGSLLSRLDRGGIFFTFASRYSAQFDSLPTKFYVDAKMLETFEEAAFDELVVYESRQGVLALLDSLKRSSQIPASSKLQALWDEIHTEFLANEREALVQERDQIRDYLEREIKKKFSNSSVRVRLDLEGDLQYQTARNLLLNSRLYNSFLKPLK
ncbi:MAG: S41 family peptidase [Candidatus Kapaibacterium sp.]